MAEVMTIKEINIYLAKHLFGKKQGMPCWWNMTGASWFEGAPPIGNRENMKPDFYYELDRIDYTAHWQQVVETLLDTDINVHSIDIFKIRNIQYEVTVFSRKGEIVMRGDTCGEAVCRATVEYLKEAIK